MSKLRIAMLLALGAVTGASFADNPRDPSYYWEKARPNGVAEPAKPDVQANVPTHRVYACHPSDRIWKVTQVANAQGESESDVVEPAFRSQCPMGSGIVSYQPASSTTYAPYDDSGNPRDPHHVFSH